MPLQKRPVKNRIDWTKKGSKGEGANTEPLFRHLCETGIDDLSKQQSPAADWQAALEAAVVSFEGAAAEKHHVLVKMESLEKQILELRAQIVNLRDGAPLQVPIRSLAPWNLEVIIEIPAIVQKIDDDYVATFFDANIGMSGDSQEESIENLKALIADTFDELEAEEAILGPGLVRTLATLREFVKRKA